MNTIYLNLPVAIQRIGDAELVEEMLVMLHKSLPQDWQACETLLAENELLEAEKVIHQIKGTIPFFSDEMTADLLQQMDVLLKTATDIEQVREKFTILQTRMNGFQIELNDWFSKTQV
jgi:HPt (histidine-containing phosphotransfer) domain-containing protein